MVGEVAARHLRPQTDAQTVAYAHKLGLALQLTNIIRDVGEDARRGRIYLPVNELQQFDVKAHEISQRAVELQRALRRADAASRPSARTAPTTRRWRCCPRPTGARRSPG